MFRSIKIRPAHILEGAVILRHSRPVPPILLPLMGVEQNPGRRFLEIFAHTCNYFIKHVDFRFVFTICQLLLLVKVQKPADRIWGRQRDNFHIFCDIFPVVNEDAFDTLGKYDVY